MAAARTLKVFTDVKARDAVTANPNGVLSLAVKKDKKTGKPKEYNGSIFITAAYTIAGQKNDGWFRTTVDMKLMRGVADPTNVQDGRNKYAGTRNQLEFKLSEAGPAGQFLNQLNVAFLSEIERLVAAKELIKGSRKIHELLQYKLSEENTENPNGALDEPILRIQLEDGVFSKEYPYPFLRGQPKTVFLDARTEYKDAKGVVQYRTATYTDENGAEIPVTLANMHNFIKSGATIKAGSRFMMPSACRSQSWISLPIIWNKVIIEPRQEIEGFDDEVPVDLEAVKQALAQSTGADGVPTVPVKDTAVPDQPPVEPIQPPNPIVEPVVQKQVDEINDVLNNI